jgi:E3 ubiquitin-protein ligase HERC1
MKKHCVVVVNCFFCFIKQEDGRLFGIGNASLGQLGTGNLNNQTSLTPIDYPSSDTAPFRLIRCGWVHSMAVTERGLCYSWGAAHFNQLGHGNFDTTNVPTLVELLKDKSVKNVSCGLNHSLVLCSKNTAQERVETIVI